VAHEIGRHLPLVDVLDRDADQSVRPVGIGRQRIGPPVAHAVDVQANSQELARLVPGPAIPRLHQDGRGVGRLVIDLHDPAAQLARRPQRVDQLEVWTEAAKRLCLSLAAQLAYCLLDVARRVPTAPLSAAGLIAGFAVAVASGSRPLGGLVLAGFGLACISIWRRRDGARIATILAAVGVLAFALSHLLGLLIGAWPAVFAAAATVAGATWRLSDARRSVRPTVGAGV
jgi:hypothetical protein